MHRIWGIAFLTSVVWAAPSHAAVFTVDTPTDVADAAIDGVCDSDPGVGVACTLRAAVQEANVTAAPDTVALPAATITLTISGGAPSEGNPAVGDIDSVNPLVIDGSATILDANGIDRIFEARSGSGSFAVEGVTFRNGLTSGVGGGAIHSAVPITVTNSVFEGNSTTNNDGGAIIAFAPLELDNVAFRNNQTQSNGGAVGVFGGLEARNVIAEDNIAHNIDAGAFNAVGGDVTIENATFARNRAPRNNGGAVYVSGGDDVILRDATFDGDRAGPDELGDGGAASLSGSSILVERVTIRGTRASNAGGLQLRCCGLAVVRDSSIEGAVAEFGDGGGIEGGDDVLLERVTLARNTAQSSGGGAYLRDRAVIVNSTVSGNEATTQSGGGLRVGENAQLRNVTITANSALTRPSDGIQVFTTIEPSLLNTVISGNGTSDCDNPVISAGGNVSAGTTCGLMQPSDRQGVDPGLGALGVMPGARGRMHALTASSAAVDAGLTAGCPATDQAGEARPALGGCDAGADEFVPAPPGSPPPAAGGGAPGPSAPAPPAPPAQGVLPALKASKVFAFPTTRRCVSRRAFRIRLRVPKGAKLSSVSVFVNGKRVKSRRGKRVTSVVDLRGLPKGRFSVRIMVVLADGRRVTGTRRYRTCARKRSGTSRPRL